MLGLLVGGQRLRGHMQLFCSQVVWFCVPESSSKDFQREHDQRSASSRQGLMRCVHVAPHMLCVLLPPRPHIHTHTQVVSCLLGRRQQQPTRQATAVCCCVQQHTSSTRAANEKRHASRRQQRRRQQMLTQQTQMRVRLVGRLSLYSQRCRTKSARCVGRGRAGAFVFTAVAAAAPAAARCWLCAHETWHWPKVAAQASTQLQYVCLGLQYNCCLVVCMLLLAVPVKKTSGRNFSTAALPVGPCSAHSRVGRCQAA